MGKRAVRGGSSKSESLNVGCLSPEAAAERLAGFSKEKPRIYKQFERDYHALMDGEYVETILAVLARDPFFAARVTELMKGASRRSKTAPMGTFVLPHGGKSDAWKRAGTPARAALERWLKDTSREPFTQNLHEFATSVVVMKVGTADGDREQQIGTPDDTSTSHSGGFLSSLIAFSDIKAMRDALAAELSALATGVNLQGAEQPDLAAESPAEISASKAAADRCKGLEREVRDLRKSLASTESAREKFHAQLSTQSRKNQQAESALSEATSKLEVATARIEELEGERKILATDAIKANAELTAERTGREGAVADRDDLQRRVDRLTAERDQALAHAIRVESSLTWQRSETDKQAKMVAARDRLLEKIGVHNLVASIGTLAESLNVIGALQGALSDFQAMQDEQARVERESEAMWQKHHDEAHEENERRTRAYEQEERRLANDRGVRIDDFERGVTKAGVTRIIVDGHNLMMHRWAELAGESDNRAHLLDLLDEMGARLNLGGTGVRIDVCFDHRGVANKTVSPRGLATVWFDTNDKTAERGTTGADRRIAQIIEDGSPDDVYSVYSNDRVDVHAAVKRLQGELEYEIHPHGVAQFIDYLEDIDALASEMSGAA